MTVFKIVSADSRVFFTEAADPDAARALVHANFSETGGEMVVGRNHPGAGGLKKT